MWGAVECRKALFLKRLSRKEEAVESVLLSIKGYPWNWSAWLLLASCLGDRDEVNLEIQIESVLFFVLKKLLMVFSIFMNINNNLK